MPLFEEYKELVLATLDYLKNESPFFIKGEKDDLVFFQNFKSVPPRAALLDKKNALIPIKENGVDDIKEILNKIAPPNLLIMEIPECNLEQQKCVRGAELTILANGKNHNELTFLKGLAQGLDFYFYKAAILDINALEQKKEWDFLLSFSHIKLIICTANGIKNSPNLLKHYRALPSQGKNFLGKIPLFLLDDLNHYFKNYKLKGTLWNTLSQKIKELI